MITAGNAAFTEWLSSNKNISTHVNDCYVKAALGMLLIYHDKNEEIQRMNNACDISLFLKYC